MGQETELVPSVVFAELELSDRPLAAAAAGSATPADALPGTAARPSAVQTWHAWPRASGERPGGERASGEPEEEGPDVGPTPDVSRARRYLVADGKVRLGGAGGGGGRREGGALSWWRRWWRVEEQQQHSPSRQQTRAAEM